VVVVSAVVLYAVAGAAAAVLEAAGVDPLPALFLIDVSDHNGHFLH